MDCEKIETVSMSDHTGSPTCGGASDNWIYCLVSMERCRSCEIKPAFAYLDTEKI